MKIFILTLFTALICSAGFAQTHLPPPDGEVELGQLVEKMIASIKAAKTLKFRLVENERYGGKIVKSEQCVKLNVSPKKIYIKLLKGPHTGSEILFVNGMNNNKALISISSFIPTISLSPFSSLLRDQQRHTIYELGFSYIGDLMYDAYLRYKDDVSDHIKYEGTTVYDNRECYKITLDNKEYKLRDYQVLEGEDLIKIARKFKLNEYSLLEYNPSVKGYTEVKAGQVIKIPDTFCKTVTMFVDTKTFLPVYQKIVDSIGFVGEYEYHDLQINIPIADEEFTKKFKDYDF